MIHFRNKYIQVALLLGLPLLLALPLFWAGFVFDDLHSIVRNGAVQQIGNLGRFFVDPTCFSANPHNVMYRPLLLTTFALNHFLGGMAPGYWHLGNLILHLATVWLLYRLLRRLLPENPVIALFAALVFAIHPLQVEVLGQVSSRSDLLLGLCLCGCLYMLVRALSAPQPGYGFLLGAWLAAAGAMLTKEPGVLVPLAALPLLFTCQPTSLTWRQQGRRLILALGPIVVVALGYLLLRRHLLGMATVGMPVMTGGADPLVGHGRDLVTQLSTQVVALGQAVGLFFLPWNLSADHQVPFQTTPFALPVIGWGIILLGFILGIWALAKRRFLAGAGLWWMAIILAPVVIVPLNQIFAEHRLYGPGLGLAIALAVALAGIKARGFGVPFPRRLSLTMVTVVLVLLGGRFLVRTWDWRNPGTLWRSTLAVNPDSFKAWSQLGQFLGDQGDETAALTCWERAHALYPRNRDIAINHIEYTVRVAEASRDVDLAFAARDAAWLCIQRYPWSVDPRTKLCRAELVLGNLAKDSRAALRAAAVATSVFSFAAPHPNFFGAWSMALEGAGKPAEALAMWDWSDQLVRFNSRNIGPRLGFLMRQGKKEEVHRRLARAVGADGPLADPRSLSLLRQLNREFKPGPAQRAGANSPIPATPIR